MRLCKEREYGNSQILQTALHLGEMGEAGDRSGPGTSPRPPPHGGRQIPEEHLDHTNRQMSLEFPPKEVELGRAALDEEDFAAPRRAASPTPPKVRTPTATSAGVIPRAAARITVSFKNPSRWVRTGASATLRPRTHLCRVAPPRTRSA
jgi:hypothetical protein